MGSRASLNKVLLIGNLTRDPELRYTPSGAAVCSFGLATNRTYVSSDGTKKEEAEFMKIVAWNKLAELCSQLLTKGRKVYVEGRMQTRSWETPDGVTKQTTEIVIDDMRILDSRRDFMPEAEGVVPGAISVPAEPQGIVQAKDDAENSAVNEPKTAGAKKPAKQSKSGGGDNGDDKVDLEDLPF